MNQVRPGHRDMQSTKSIDQIYLRHPNLPKKNFGYRLDDSFRRWFKKR